MIAAMHMGIQPMSFNNWSTAYMLLYYVSKFYHVWSKDVEMPTLSCVFVDFPSDYKYPLTFYWKTVRIFSAQKILTFFNIKRVFALYVVSMNTERVNVSKTGLP